MKKTAGSLLADLLIAQDKGTTKEELEKRELELKKQTEKQLSIDPSIKITVK